MLRSRRWMLLAMVLALVAGASLGVAGDRLMLGEEKSGLVARSHSHGTIWFPCDDRGGALGSRQDPAADPSSAPSENPDSQKRRTDRHARHMEKMSAELQLDAQQEEAVREVMRDQGSLARSFWGRTRDDYCGMREQMRSDIEALLRPEQVPLLQERIRRFEERAAARFSTKGKPRSGA